MMSSCVPAPQDTSPSGVLMPTYAMALEFDPCSMACSWYLMMEYRYPRLALSALLTASRRPLPCAVNTCSSLPPLNTVMVAMMPFSCLKCASTTSSGSKKLTYVSIKMASMSSPCISRCCRSEMRLTVYPKSSRIAAGRS